MLEDRYVTFEIAKLLKEKGFDVPIYTSCTKKYKDERPDISIWRSDRKENFNDLDEKENSSGFYSCPTQQMALAWLREKNIDIIPFHELFEKDYYWCRIEKKYGWMLHTELQQYPMYTSYENAVDDAIKYALENLV